MLRAPYAQTKSMKTASNAKNADDQVTIGFGFVSD